MKQRFIGWLFFILTSYCTGATPKIGIMLESDDVTARAPSLDEKLCIIKAMEEREGLSFSIYENHRSLRESAEAAEQMVIDKIDLALLPVISNEAIAAATILREAGIPFLTSATSDSVIRDSSDGLSLFPRNSDQAEILAQYYSEHYSDRPVTVITDDSSAYSKQLSAQFLAQLRILNLSVEIEEHHIVGSSLDRLPDLSDHVVFAALFNPAIALLYLQLQSNDNVVLLGPDSIGVRTEFLQIVGEQPDKGSTDVIFLKNWDGEVRGANHEDFWSVFYQGCRRQKVPTFVNVYVYDMMQLVLQWLATQPPEAPLQAIHDSESNSVITGKPIEFSTNGYRKSSYFFYKYSGGTSAIPLR